MQKDVLKIIRKLLQLFLPIVFILSIYSNFFKMYYLDPEYPMYAQQKEFITSGSENAQILIIGDSRTKADFICSQLSDSTYNIGLGGATPLEGYYHLKNYLSHHTKPKTVIIAYAPFHYMDVDTFYSRSIYFHNLDFKDVLDVYDQAKSFKDVDKILIQNYGIEYAMYYLHLPNKYAVAMRKAGFVFRFKENQKKYLSVQNSRGHSFYGLLDSSDSFNAEAKVKDFEDSDILDDYLSKMLDLCIENDIQVILEQTPINEASHQIITEDFKKNYRTYLEKLQNEHPTALIHPNFYWYENQYFGDADHLNPSGANVFTQYIKEKYSTVFE